MCAKPAAPEIRTALVETAAHIIATEGLGKLTLRRLAADVGTSTMAIYTHFGGMDELRRAVRREGFVRLGRALAAVGETDDPVADFLVLGWAYHLNATANPDLYRAMFLDGPIDAEDRETGLETFAVCMEATERCQEVGRFHAGDARARATELWAILHGLVTLEMAELIDDDAVVATLAAAATDLFRAWGDSADAVAASFEAARPRLGRDAPPVGLEPTT